MNWWLAAGSLAAVLALAGIAWALGLGGAQRLARDDEAATLAEQLVSGFEAHAAIVATGGQIAAVAGGPGDLVLIRPLGARFHARRILGARVAAVDDATITLEFAPGDLATITISDKVAAQVFAAALGDCSPAKAGAQDHKLRRS